MHDPLTDPEDLEAARARQAAAYYFADEMEECPGCSEYVPYEELETIIGTPKLCLACRRKLKEDLLAEMREPVFMGLS